MDGKERFGAGDMGGEEGLRLGGVGEGLRVGRM